MLKIDFIALIAIFGTVHGLFIASLFWLKKNKDLSNRLFSLLLFATSIRIAKNIIVYLTSIDDGLELSESAWRFSINFGISHQFAIGPLFLFYFKSRIEPKLQFTHRNLIHFIPYLLLILGSAIIPWSFWRDGGLYASYAHILIYYLVAFKVYYHAKSSNSNTDVMKWLRTMLLVSAVLMIAYSPSLFKYVGYIGGASLYAIAVYIISWIVLKDKKLSKSERYQTSALKTEQAEQIKDQLHQLVEIEARYIDDQLSLTKLAELMQVNSNYISQVINQEFKMSYAEYINSLRLNEIKKRLIDPKYKHLKIAAIAYDCGYESISHFNTSFKKTVGQTPSEYRSQAEQTEVL